MSNAFRSSKVGYLAAALFLLANLLVPSVNCQGEAPAPSPFSSLSKAYDTSEPPTPYEADNGFLNGTPPPSTFEQATGTNGVGAVDDDDQSTATPQETVVYVSSPEDSGEKLSQAQLLGIVIGAVLFFIVLCALICICRARQRNIQRARYGNTGAGSGQVEVF